MFPDNTELAYWTCPNCKGEQEIILVTNLELPHQLECDDCGHKRGRMDWANEEVEE